MPFGNNNAGGGGFGSDALAFGMMNSIKTGNPLIDIMCCSIITPLLQSVQSLVDNTRPWLTTVWKFVKRRGRNEYRRVIRYERRMTNWGSEAIDKEGKNNILQKAITLYLSREHGLKKTENAEFKLMAIGQEKYSGYSWCRTYGSTSDELKQYSIATSITENEWIEIEPGVWFITLTDDGEGEKDSGDGGDGGQPATTSVTFEFLSSLPDGKQRIAAFMDKAYHWYVAQVKSQTDNSRYLYTMEIGARASGGDDGDGDGDNSGDGGGKFKRYKLSGEKTFKSLFFPQKERLLGLLDQFNRKTDKFEIPGFPWKLGLLLHGPPGTGKTSLIKALAEYTGRNVVNIALGRIKTNQELMDLAFDLKFAVAGEDVPIKLDFTKIIFVLEDVDAATTVVHDRSAAAKAKAANAAAYADGGGGGLADSDSDDDFEKPDPIMALMMAMSKLEGPANKKDGATGGAMGAMTGFGSSWESETIDKLDLSGVLNVLDGVVDSPGRIVVMTSNHPEKLDPALIRPGRINLKLMLGYVELPEATEMIQFYFGGYKTGEPMAARHVELLAATWGRLRDAGVSLTPAQLEQLCAEHDTVDELCAGLSDMAYGVKTDADHTREA